MIAKQIDPKYGTRLNGTESSYQDASSLNRALEALKDASRLLRIEIVNMTGEPIPEDEPLILFRARDYLALPMLVHYSKLAMRDGCTDFHIAGIDNRIEAFRKFKAEHPERMKQPGITKGL